ncbi:GbsR/MarR family transcriptional regulator [Flavobacterium tegetincola]|uniref:GbsR/MarR family transcriptional regulator n=1 Tax=Flavobacterium tegetincola TaxID=150172 RepID=UPI0004199390|nr:helix-turn-helix domain-containing protein [Flavobacterium tegetincola]
MMEIEKEKAELIEMFGVFFENTHHLPPLASRILGNLILDGCKTGLTFEDLVERMAASKSTVSTSLNLLLKSEKITYYTLSGDRKKYYKPSPFSNRLQTYLKMIALEKTIIEKMLGYREKTASCFEERCNLENMQEYKKHILTVESLLENTIQRFKEIEHNNNQNQI